MVRHCRRHDQPMDLGKTLGQRRPHLRRRHHRTGVQRVQPTGGHVAQGAMDKLHGSAPQRGHEGHGHAHAATAGVGQATDRVQEFPRWPGAAKNAQALEISHAPCGEGCSDAL